MSSFSIPVKNLFERYHDEADAYAAEFGFTGASNGNSDAFRHAYASAEMTREYGAAFAAAAGTAWEVLGYFHPNNTSAATNMDLWNNARGRELGSTSTSSRDSAERARGATTDGTLITNIGDPRERYSDDTSSNPGFGFDPLGNPTGVGTEVNRDYTNARGWSLPRDPLVLDLDGDGIEAVGINPNAPVLFDHDANGVKTGTGWIKSDDGLLVLDINGNGTIDSGRELFGDNTLTPATDGNGNPVTVNAQNGYQALAQYDTNHDGQINSQDTIYSQLRVWRDLNQDGISQANELQSLSQTGIASIGVQGTADNVNLGNGNSQVFSGSVTRTDGSAGQSGVAELSGSLLLASNNFYRQFTDNPALTSRPCETLKPQHP